MKKMIMMLVMMVLMASAAEAKVSDYLRSGFLTDAENIIKYGPLARYGYEAKVAGVIVEKIMILYAQKYHPEVKDIVDIFKFLTDQEFKNVFITSAITVFQLPSDQTLPRIYINYISEYDCMNLSQWKDCELIQL